jgi:nitrile hydratase subunit beta
MDQPSARAHHDLGGVERFMCVRVDTEPYSLTDFDKQVDALRQLLGAKGMMSVDEHRRGIEAIPEEDYFRLTYYQKWLRSITDTLLRKGIIDADELRQKLAAP